jgi:hypothetical protein
MPCQNGFRTSLQAEHATAWSLLCKHNPSISVCAKRRDDQRHAFVPTAQDSLKRLLETHRKPLKVMYSIKSANRRAAVAKIFEIL